MFLEKFAGNIHGNNKYENYALQGLCFNCLLPGMTTFLKIEFLISKIKFCISRGKVL